MKRPLIILSSVVVLIVLALVGATFAMGILTEKAVDSYSSQIEESSNLSAVDLKVVDYERGFGKSTFSSTITIKGLDVPIVLDHEAYHGPLAFTPDGAKPGYSYIISTMNRESLPEETREKMNAIYGDSEPVSIKTTIELDGDRESVVTFAAVDHKSDDMSMRFEGGEIEILGDSGASSATGRVEFSPLSVEMKDEAGDELRLRHGGTTATFAAKESGFISMDGEMKKMSFHAGGEDSFRCSSEATKMTADYAPVEGAEGLVEGKAAITFPSLEIQAGESGKFVASGLTVASESSNEAGNLLKYHVTYGADAFAAEMAGETEEMAWMKMLESGLELTMSGTVPHAVAREFAAFQKEQGGMATTPEAVAENQIAVAELLEAALRKMNRGSAVTLGVRVGPEEEGVKVNLDIDYDEERPITSRKSYMELLKAINLNLSATVPKTMLEETPSLEEQLGSLKAMGMVKEDLSGYKASLTSTRGNVRVNGEPNPMFEQMAPMLMMPIDWEAIFKGMRMAAEAKASAHSDDSDEEP